MANLHSPMFLYREGSALLQVRLHEGKCSAACVAKYHHTNYITFTFTALFIK